MIHEIGVELQAALRAIGCPIPVVDGPEPTTTTTYARERIVIQYDEDAGDSFDPVMSQHKNPKYRGTDRFGVKITIYAQEPRAGALEFEHRRRVHRVRRAVVVALGDVLIPRRNPWEHKGGKLVQPADLAKSETIAGAAYELKITIAAGLPVRDWAGSAEPEATLTGDAGGVSIHSTTTVDNETAC